ncbi:replication protein, partial [Candidatus Poribacteria bacterium]
MAYPEPRQEPYTKYPNRYSDLIKPRLTGTQRDICDIVIRMTYGWHQTSAAISNTVFAKKASKSKQGIIKARKQLEEIGILVVLQEGGGSKTNEYMLDLWYDNPDKSVKASIIRQEEQLLEMENPPSQEEQEDILEILETSAIDGPTIFEKPEVEIET